jgi:hypothetical protein
VDTQEIEAPAVPLAECDQFICFFDFGHGSDEEEYRYPVGVGKTRDEALAAGIRNVMPTIADLGVMGMYNSGWVTISQPQLTADEFATVGTVVADFFAGRTKLRTTPE